MAEDDHHDESAKHKATGKINARRPPAPLPSSLNNLSALASSSPVANDPPVVEIRGYLALADPANRAISRFTQEARRHQQQQQQFEPVSTMTAVPAVAVAEAVAVGQQEEPQEAAAHREDSKRQRLRQQHQRRRYRVNQRRHRDKEKSKPFNLMLDINQLKQQIAQLESKKQALLVLSEMPKLHRDTLCGMLSQYFHMFRHGFRPMTEFAVPRQAFPVTSVGDDGTVAPIARKPMAVESQQQEQFFRWLYVDQVVRTDGVVTVDQLLEHWRRLPLCYPDIQVKVVSYDTIHNKPQPAYQQDLDRDECMVRVNLVFSSTISHVTLAKCFPHVLNNPTISRQVLGQRLNVEGTWIFHFDRQDKITHHLVDMDMFSAMHHIVRQVQPLMTIMTGAVATRTCPVGIPGTAKHHHTLHSHLHSHSAIHDHALPAHSTPVMSASASDEDSFVEKRTAASKLMDLRFLLNE